jgi:hypothetical protein
MTNEEIAAEFVKTVKPVTPLTCPTCGAQMDLVLVGKVNAVYVTLCPNIVVQHPTWICTPSMSFDNPD